jgi:cyclase
VSFWSTVLDRDGTKSGFDLDLLKSILQSVNVPVIASSGAGSMQDFLNVFQNTTVAAALGARVFHDQTVQITKLKNFLFYQRCHCANMRRLNITKLDFKS